MPFLQSLSNVDNFENNEGYDPQKGVFNPLEFNTRCTLHDSINQECPIIIIAGSLRNNTDAFYLLPFLPRSAKRYEKCEGEKGETRNVFSETSLQPRISLLNTYTEIPRVACPFLS